MKLARCRFTCRPNFCVFCRSARWSGLAGKNPSTLDIRVIAATNRDLKAAIAQKTFREDLYFRLTAFKLAIPSLSERPKDILPLAEQFLSSTKRRLPGLALNPGGSAEPGKLSLAWQCARAAKCPGARHGLGQRRADRCSASVCLTIFRAQTVSAAQAENLDNPFASHCQHPQSARPRAIATICGRSQASP